MSSKFSPYVIKALVDTITGDAGNDTAPAFSIYRSGPKIKQFFLDCGFDMRIGSSSRVPATTDFLRQTAQHYDGQGDTYIARIIEKASDPREYLSDPEKAAAVREHLSAQGNTSRLAPGCIPTIDLKVGRLKRRKVCSFARRTHPARQVQSRSARAGDGR
jgi:hypothetical protein